MKSLFIVKNMQADLLNRLYCREKDAGRKYCKHSFTWATKLAVAGERQVRVLDRSIRRNNFSVEYGVKY